MSRKPRDCPTIRDAATHVHVHAKNLQTDLQTDPQRIRSRYSRKLDVLRKTMKVLSVGIRRAQLLSMNECAPSPSWYTTY